MKADGPIRVVVDPDIKDLLPEYLENLATYASQVADALERSDFAAIKKVGHQLKGIGTAYGFHWISELGTRMEPAAQAQDRTALEPVPAQMRDYLQRIEIVWGIEG
jgi:HPt (histidine-containing phosphotransfer) domain-containing protein